MGGGLCLRGGGSGRFLGLSSTECMHIAHNTHKQGNQNICFYPFLHQSRLLVLANISKNI
ncbi:hypothetical protein BKH46_00895 [Helicobacter sp. 12S02634-8]|nr:hypothetical protein BKH46_00895 [Helicobacter sp. 12S02634-8]